MKRKNNWEINREYFHKNVKRAHTTEEGSIDLFDNISS